MDTGLFGMYNTEDAGFPDGLDQEGAYEWAGWSACHFFGFPCL